MAWASVMAKSILRFANVDFFAMGLKKACELVIRCMHPKLKTFFVWSFLLIGQLNFTSAQYCGDKPIMLHYYDSQIHDKVVDFCFHSLCINFLVLPQIPLCYKLPKVEVVQIVSPFHISWLEIYLTIHMVKGCIIMK